MTWDEVKELAPLYVIGALDEKTAHDLEASLNGATPEQRRVVARWLDVAALLPQALPLQTPQAHIKERVLNRIAEDAQKTPIEIAVEESTLKRWPSGPRRRSCRSFKLAAPNRGPRGGC